MVRRFSLGAAIVLAATLLAATSWSADWYVTTTGSDVTGVGTPGLPWRTIPWALTHSSTGDIIHVVSGPSPTFFFGQIVVNVGVTIKGEGPLRPILDFSGVASGKPTLIDIGTDNVTLNFLELRVDQSQLRSAVIASGADIDSVTLTSVNIIPRGTPAGDAGDRNAVSINYRGLTDYRVATGGVSKIVIQNSTITGPNGVTPFVLGVATDESGGSFTGNTLTASNADVLARLGSNGDVTLSNNALNGGGVEVSDLEAGAGNLLIASNTFNGTKAETLHPGFAMLRLRNNTNSKSTTVNGNTFTAYRWGVSLENYNSVNVANNVFNELANTATCHDVTVNTKAITPTSAAVTQVTTSATIQNNVFGGSNVSGGFAVTFLNHDSDAASFGTCTVVHNSFSASYTTDISEDGQSGSSTTSTFPDYNTMIGSGGGAVTTMAPWSAPIAGTCNWYGTTDAPTIAALVGPHVAYVPYLSDGSDIDPAIGFQPGGTCNPALAVPEAPTLQLSVRVAPNPARGAAIFLFVLPRPGHASLRVFDAEGRRVAELVDTQLPAGQHDAVFANGRRGAQLYLYRLESGGREIHGRFALLE